MLVFLKIPYNSYTSDNLLKETILFVFLNSNFNQLIIKHNQARMGWNKSCIGLDDKGSIKVDREKAEILVARYAKSDIMEGK